ncbi:MAG: hypothetical protein WC659_07030 [Patescibacteria group bacterium]
MPSYMPEAGEKDPALWKLALAEYFARRKELLRRVVVFLFFLCDVAILAGLWVTYINYSAGVAQHTALEGSLNDTYVDIASYRASHKVLPLEVVQVESVEGAEGYGDIVAALRNPNEQWIADDVQVQFFIGTKRLPAVTTFLLPMETRIVASFRQQFRKGEVPRVELSSLSWWRMQGDPRLDISSLTVQGYRYVPLGNGTTRLDFEVVNASPYSFWVVPVTIVAWQGQHIAAAYLTTLEQLTSGETRAASVAWQELLPQITRTTADIALNTLDPNILMPLPAETVSPFGD